jgi:hypothetical protein
MNIAWLLVVSGCLLRVQSCSVHVQVDGQETSTCGPAGEPCLTFDHAWSRSDPLACYTLELGNGTFVSSIRHTLNSGDPVRSIVGLSTQQTILKSAGFKLDVSSGISVRLMSVWPSSDAPSLFALSQVGVGEV